jgi:hypothetical protein
MVAKCYIKYTVLVELPVHNPFHQSLAFEGIFFILSSLLNMLSIMICMYSSVSLYNLLIKTAVIHPFALYLLGIIEYCSYTGK